MNGSDTPPGNRSVYSLDPCSSGHRHAPLLRPIVNILNRLAVDSGKMSEFEVMRRSDFQHPFGSVVGSGLTRDTSLGFVDICVPDADKPLHTIGKKRRLAPKGIANFSAIGEKALRPGKLMGNFMLAFFGCLHLYVDDNLRFFYLGNDDEVRAFAFALGTLEDRVG